MRPILKVAKTGKDLRDIEAKDMSLNSDLLLPKVYAVKKLTPIIAPGDVWGYGEYLHGRGYPPMFLFYIQQKNFLGDDALEPFNPPRFAYGSYGQFYVMDSTKFVTPPAYPADLPPYLVVFADPLDPPGTKPPPTPLEAPRLKMGSDLDTNSDYEKTIDSKFLSLKVHMLGQLVCNIPAWTATDPFGGDSVRVDWFSVTHDLGFPPVHTPFISNVGLDLVNAFEESLPADFLINDANDKWAERWPYFYPQQDYGEEVYLYVDTTKLYIGYRRRNSDLSGPHTFPARTARLNYTIFDLPINQEFNLLQS